MRNQLPKRLRPELLSLLREVMTKQQPDLLPEVDRLDRGLPISRADGRVMQQLIIDEFMRTGFTETNEIAKRGFMLEEIGDFL